MSKELLTEILEEQRKGNEEQRKTNALLLTLIEGMAEQEEQDPDAEPMTYMDGTPVAPPTTEWRPGR